MKTSINQIELSCRAAKDPVIHTEEEGKPVFVTVFCLHNKPSPSGECIITMPIVVKANERLACQLHQNIKKGYRFKVSGQLDYWKNPETNRENYSISADTIGEITQPKNEFHSLISIEL